MIVCDGHTRLKQWLKFAVGLGMFASLVLIFASGITPPGPLGEVLRHNERYHIDASAMFYTEVENMTDLENGLEELRAARKSNYER